MSEERFSNLLAAARAGDEGAWEEIFEELAPVVLGYLRANGAPDPEDIVGETFLQVARDISSFDGEESGFRSWVFTIAHHRLIDARRYAARRPVELAAEPPEPGERADDAAEEALARIGTERVERILADLSEDQRAVLLLRFVADMGIEDVAKVVGKRPGAVKALQRRGLAAVKRLLARKGVPL
ncbi:MAG TPA: RNA polymerase sigma factor [Solirubrobacterales bacterium]|nr:RNA polymerase sigma factor [Solirubrobacterales bacterium]